MGMAMEVTTLARGRLRLSLDTLVLAMAMLDMVLEATMAMEAITLARGRLRLSLDTLVLAMLATEATTSASKLSSRLLPSSAAIRSKQDCEVKCPSTFINVQMFLYFSKF